MKPDISIIIEWENVVLADMDRSIRMLEQLKKQIPALDRQVEVIILFNPEQIERSLLENELFKRLEPDENNLSFSVRTEEAIGKHYYELKNEGAKLAGGEIVVFLDSDVIPEDGWLINLVAPLFKNKDIKVLAGNTYLEYQSLKSKAFALAWFFNLRTDNHNFGIRNQRFQANNVAFRKEIITAYPFPAMPEGVTRKSCVMLAKQLEREGIPVWTNTGAQVSHPAPNGFHHFLIRALAQGRDTLLYDHPGFPAFFIEFYVKKMISSPVKIIVNRKYADLPIWQAPVAMGIMFTYYTLALAGAVITSVSPRYAKSSWKI